MQIDGSKIVVTGASSGIGEALAPMLAERGATVGIVARPCGQARSHSRALSETLAGLEDVGCRPVDLDAAVALVETAWSQLGEVDCLINNAAVGKRKFLTDHTPEDLEYVMRTNFLSPVRMNLALLPKMLERGSGAIVNVASGGGRFGIVHESAYCAAKFALSGWTRSRRWIWPTCRWR